ncbi:hypothetical protein BG011_004596 [Mortierella polycephala]|uniref:Uncharacterized protein n=1 Tax=Mortierella polycephala TaxID=41804 RepID=A0A9P6Q1F2_9FUNG|nr:hypothetical protein BG011_004596 [Mortierella polycephala]
MSSPLNPGLNQGKRPEQDGTMHAAPISPAPAPALESTPIPVSAPSASPSVAPATDAGIPASSPQELGPVVEVSDSLDPLSHLTHIFEKIRKQVIEWGEDANWKIDVFLLPNEDGSASTPGLAMGSDTQILSPVPPPAAAPRIDLTDSPRRQVKEIKDVDKSHATKALGFELQPPPNDLQLITKEKVLSLKEADISNLSESETKRMLSLAVRQLHEQREFTSRVMHDLDSLQRMSARRERDVEARLDAERRLIERDNVILSRKWDETSRLLKERDREIQDVHMQLETGKRIIMERNEDRRKTYFTKTRSYRESMNMALSNEHHLVNTMLPLRPNCRQLQVDLRINNVVISIATDTSIIIDIITVLVGETKVDRMTHTTLEQIR